MLHISDKEVWDKLWEKMIRIQVPETDDDDRRVTSKNSWRVSVKCEPKRGMKYGNAFTFSNGDDIWDTVGYATNMEKYNLKTSHNLLQMRISIKKREKTL